jgi:hypothetical protein
MFAGYTSIVVIESALGDLGGPFSSVSRNFREFYKFPTRLLLPGTTGTRIISPYQVPGAGTGTRYRYGTRYDTTTHVLVGVPSAGTDIDADVIY